MKNNLKKKLRTLLVETATQLDQAFTAESSLRAHPHLTAVKRLKNVDRWEFIALAFSTLADRFFLEVAISRKNEYPIDKIPLGPRWSHPDGVLRFRAADLWDNPQSGGWLICNDWENRPKDLLLPPEGVFADPEGAMVDVKARIQVFIFPYLNSGNNES
jgi:hypothetical protein